MSHTPGPWIVGISGDESDGHSYAEIEAPALGTRNIAGDFGRVATMDGVLQADACLMAAAPDMEEALIEARDFIDQCLFNVPSAASFNAVQAKIAAALAKADGKP